MGLGGDHRRGGRGWYLIGQDYGPDYHRYQDAVDPILDNLETVESYGWSRHNVFTDWLDMMLYALQSRDDPYLEIVDRYDCNRPRGERAPDLYSAAFAALQAGMAETNADLLGVIYETYGMASDAFGQYFTPHNLCEMMAEMQVGDLDRETVRERRGAGNPVTVKDPACGSGRLLVMAAQEYPEVVYYGVDKSETCAKMTALNLCLFNVDGVVVHGDSLAMDAYTTWRTTGSMLGGSVEELPDADPFTDSGDSAGDEGTGDKHQHPELGGMDESGDVTLRDTSLSDFQ